MRDIEFRGKDIANNKWLYGDLTFNESMDAWFIRRRQAGCDIPVYPETVGQYTGLVDSKSVKIYEGDIVLYKDIKLPVRWDNEEAGFFVGKDKYWMMNDMNLDVIGNIHDNPDLLVTKSEIASA
jgi:uncharacterized phage protein (TIGR01671 family)